MKIEDKKKRKLFFAVALRRLLKMNVSLN